MYESFSSTKPSVQWLGDTKPLQTLEGPGDSGSSFPWGLVGTVVVIGLVLYFVSGSASISVGRDNPKLITSQNTSAAEKKVRSAAAAKFGRGRANIFYEHGQWWADVNGQMWSAVDAYPGIVHGIDFESLG